MEGGIVRRGKSARRGKPKGRAVDSAALEDIRALLDKAPGNFPIVTR